MRGYPKHLTRQAVIFMIKDFCEKKPVTDIYDLMTRFNISWYLSRKFLEILDARYPTEFRLMRGEHQSYKLINLKFFPKAHLAKSVIDRDGDVSLVWKKESSINTIEKNEEEDEKENEEKEYGDEDE
ncbi:MAG: hypothetical protein QXG39_04070 [Candidatus Aenigmatarchaeota archaeon]